MSNPSYLMPEDFNEFYEQWHSRFASAARAFGIYSQDLEDVVQDMMILFYEKGYPGIYDPEKGAVSTFVYTFLYPRLLGARRKLLRRKNRETPLTFVFPDGTEMLRPIEDETAANRLHNVEIAPGLTQAKAGLKKNPLLACLFNDMLRQALVEGEIDKQELAAKYGVAVVTINKRIRDMREIPSIRKWAEHCIGYKPYRFTKEQADEIRRRYLEGSETQVVLAKEFKVVQQRISEIVNYRYKTWF